MNGRLPLLMNVARRRGESDPVGLAEKLSPQDWTGSASAKARHRRGRDDPVGRERAALQPRGDAAVAATSRHMIVSTTNQLADQEQTCVSMP